MKVMPRPLHIQDVHWKEPVLSLEIEACTQRVGDVVVLSSSAAVASYLTAIVVMSALVY